MNLDDLVVEEGIPVTHTSHDTELKKFIVSMPKYSSVEFQDYKEARLLGGCIRYYGYRANVRKQPGSKYRVWKMDKRNSLGHDTERSTNGN